MIDTSWFVKRETGGWTSVDAGADGLCGVTVRVPHKPGGQPRVVKCAFIPAKPLDVQTLTDLSKKLSVPGCPWALSLNRKAYNILTIHEPTVWPQELAESVRWSISDLIDYPVVEASVAWMKIATKSLLPNRPPHLYVLAIKNEIIAGYNAIFKNAKISLQAIDVRETAQRNIAALAGRQGEGIGLLLIGKEGVHFTITFDGELYLDRFLDESLFADAPVDANTKGRMCERIVLQIQRSLDFVGRTLPFIEIKSILIAPMPGNLNLGDSISKHLQVPVKSLDLSSLFDFSEIPELAQEENQALYFNALGAALRFVNTSQQINLQHEKKSEFNFSLAATAALGLLLLSLVGLWSMREGKVAAAQRAEAASAQQLQVAEAKLKALTQQSKENLSAQIIVLRPQAEAAQRILAQTMSLGSQQGYAQYFSLLATIDKEDLWLTNVSVDQLGKSVNLTGHALRKESVMHYANRLNTLFADYGVQFTALELTLDSSGRQGGGQSQLTPVAFKLY